MSTKEKVIDQEGELIQLTPRELLPILVQHALAGESVGIEGPPGGGKSELVAQAAKLANKPLLSPLNLELSDSTDLKGLPFRDPENANQQVWVKDKRWLVDFAFTNFMDELPRASVPVQGAACMLILENRVDDVHLPEGTWHVWAGNRTADKAGANRVPTIVYNRSYMYELVYDAESHIDHELSRDDTDVLTMRYLRMKGNAAYQFDPAKKINSTPRAWSTVARRLHRDPDTHFATIAGRIGRGMTSELLAFRDLAPTLPSIEEIMLSPKTAKVPDNTSAQFLVCDVLADHATATSFDALVTYAKRLPPEFQAQFVKHSMLRKPEVTATEAFSQWGIKFTEMLR